MKRYILLVTLLLSLALVVTGCSTPSAPVSDNNEEEQEVEIKEPSLPETPEEPDLTTDQAKEEEPEEPQEPPVQPEEPKPEPEPEPKPEPKPESKPISSGGTKGMVALTFDDGPHAEYTDQILDILEENGAVATFFEVGRNLYNDPDAVRRAEALGCEVGSHSYRHADLGKMSAEDIAADLDKADAIFQEVLGHTPNLVRPPYGSLNNAVKYTTGRSIITWSIDTEDWLSRDVDKIMATVQNAGNLTGQVILMHSSYDTSVEAARKLVPWLMEQGYQLVTITDLITQHYGDEVLPNGTYGYSYFKNGKDVILPPDQPKPETPVQPEQPVQPETPTQPEQPVQPEQPETPAETQPPENSGTEGSTPPPVSGDLSAA